MTQSPSDSAAEPEGLATTPQGTGDHSHRVRALVPLAVSAVYSLALLALDALNLDDRHDDALTGLVAVTWAFLFIRYVRLMLTSTDRASTFTTTFAYPLLLLAPTLLILPTSWALFAVLVVCYVLQLRSLAAGDAFWFSFGFVLFIALVTSVGMAEVEEEQPQSELQDWPTALAWSVASLLHLGDSAVGRPLTDDGRTLSLVVGLCAVLATGLLTAQMVRWVSGVDSGQSAPPPTEPSDDNAEVLAELAQLRVAVSDLTRLLEGHSSSEDASPPR